MEKSVVISIKGKQSYQDTEDEVVELVTEGLLVKEGEEEYTLSYQESELTGLEGTLTTFQVEQGHIVLLRVGGVNAQMVFEEGRRHFSMYETPFGAFSIGINTRRMRSTLGENGGDIRIDYAIEIDHAVAGQNFFHINVREKHILALS